MIGKAQSNELKAQLECEDKSKRLKDAIAVYKSQKTLPKGDQKLLFDLALEYCIDKMAINHRVQGH